MTEEQRLRAKISDLEGRLRAQRAATSTAAKTADIALERLQTWQPVIDAARAFARDPNRVNVVFALLEAVEALPDKEPAS